MSKFFEIALLCLLASIAHATEPPVATKTAPAKAPQNELERLEQRESYAKLLEALKEAEDSLDAMTRARKFKCLKAFGNEAFCECLNEKLAVGLDFNTYIAAITRTKDELKYDTLSKEDRSLVDSAINTRNACVK